MKNFKKMLAGILSITVLSSLIVTQTLSVSAYNSSFEKNDDINQNYQIITDFVGTENWIILKPNDTVIIDCSSLDSDMDNACVEYTLDDGIHTGINTFWINDDMNETQIDKVSNAVATIDIMHLRDTKIVFDFDTYYSIDYFVFYKDYNNFNLSGEEEAITLIKSPITVGDSESTSITEFIIGESTYPRGDINLDGKVNTLDLLMLKKYLLGLMEW